MKRALVTGIAGMDGSHMADLLLSKGYNVWGLERHRSNTNRVNIKHIENQIHLIQGDLADQGSLYSAIDQAQPDEIYNFAAQSFVGDSWNLAEQTSNITGMGVLRMLEAIRLIKPSIKFHQASSSEMFGKHGVQVVNENTVFHPRSPYAVSKVYGHYITQNFRESYGMFACSSICFNHESERRGYQFVTRKITDAVARIHYKVENTIHLGNLDAKRDWGYAPEYCEGIWRMMQQDQPDDFIFATGEAHSVEEFVIEAFATVGIENWRDYITINPMYMRPAEVDYLLGDWSKAKEVLHWEPKVRYKELVKRMMFNDLTLVRNELNGK
jgi:GDPmannose 4,6-dehydratase